ncbi:MAG: nucleoside-diphosphate kinase [Armatimonadetes bacterium]|nr:nucleoside-diphosphate kinase [Armatimonadota bacterium]
MELGELEQTLVLIKPDALKVSLTGYILSQFSEFHTGLRFAGAKIVHVSRMIAEEHYAEHKGKGFYPALIEYITGRLHYPSEPRWRRVVALVYCGPGAVKKIRQIAGPTNPHVAREQAPGTIRTMGTVVPIRDDQGQVVGERMDNLVHASACDADAEREIKLWFKPNDIMPYMQAYPTETCDQHYYLKDGRLLDRYEPHSVCLVAPGDTAWKSDLEALRRLYREEPAGCALEAVIAKYLINEARESA